MKTLRAALAGLLSLLSVASAFAQSAPPNMGFQTVYGRLGQKPGDVGPGQAIPFATLLVQMGAIGSARTISTTSPLAGGGDLSANRTFSISANGIDNTLIRQSGALSLVGRFANSTGNVADIQAVAGSSCAFIESAGSIICGQLATAGIANNAVTNAKIRQSAALSLVGNSTNATANVGDISATAASGCVFEESGSAISCGPVATAGLASNAVTFAKFQTIAALSMFGNCTSATANGAAVTGTANQVLRVNGAGTACGFGAIDLSQSAAVINTLPFTNLPTLPADNLAGNPTAGAAVMQAMAIGNCTNALTYSTSTHTFGCNSTGGTGTVTSVTCGPGLTGGTITTSGTCATDPAYGGKKLLNTLVASNSVTLSDTTSLTSSYNEYEIVFENVIPATNSVGCEIQVHSGGTFQSTGYLSFVMNGTTGGGSFSGSTAFMFCGYTADVSNTGAGISGTFKIYAPSGTSVPKNWTGTYSAPRASNTAMGIGIIAGNWNSNGAIDGFQVCMSSSAPTCNVNITSGTIKIYGTK